ncbi:MAG: hypothetical protein M5R38_18335 [Candidatus Methylomirabilis sp.]|nr:hypothetical protein [Candidatus Methylomirabilis sp.]
MADDEVRAQFLHSLLFAVTQPDSRLRVIVTLRADFYDRPLMLPELGQAMRERTELVLPLTPQEIQEAIVGPAERAGVRLEPGLVATIVGDVVDQPGALPLLQFALTELFDLREGRVLTLETYERSGGVLEALARRAEELYAMMEAERQAVARQVFLRLVNVGDGSNTRRRVRWAELAGISQVNRPDLQAVLDAFGKFRLLTFDHDPAIPRADRRDRARGADPPVGAAGRMAGRKPRGAADPAAAGRGHHRLGRGGSQRQLSGDRRPAGPVRNPARLARDGAHQ